MENIERNNGQINLNTVLGALGTAGFAGFDLRNFLGGNRPAPEPLATKSDVANAREIIDLKAENGQLKAQLYTDQQINNLRTELVAGFARVDQRIDALASAQAVQNTQFSGAIGIIQNQVQEFKSVFAPYISGPTMAASEAVYNAYKPAAATAATGTGA